MLQFCKLNSSVNASPAKDKPQIKRKMKERLFIQPPELEAMTEAAACFHPITCVSTRTIVKSRHLITREWGEKPLTTRIVLWLRHGLALQ
jgi:hypothetical protein